MTPNTAPPDLDIGAVPDNTQGVVDVTIDISKCKNEYQRGMVAELYALQGNVTTRKHARRARGLMRKLIRFGILVPTSSPTPEAQDQQPQQSS